MRELSATEQRYQAIRAVIRDGRTVTEVASEWRMSLQALRGRALGAAPSLRWGEARVSGGAQPDSPISWAVSSEIDSMIEVDPSGMTRTSS